MARSTREPLRARRTSAGQLLVWIMLALLIVGLAGFSITNFGGGVTSIGKVGQRSISTNEYFTTLRAELNAFSAQVGQPVGFAQAQTLGLDRMVLQRLAGEAALDNEADRVGVSAGDERVVRELHGLAAFRNAQGAFDTQVYRLVLDQNGLRPAEFEERLRRDLGRTLLRGAVGNGFGAPAGLVDPIFAFYAERRGYSLLRLTEADLPEPLPEPDEAMLRAHYEEHLLRFTRPEAKTIAYATLLPADVAATIEVAEEDLRRAYQSRIAEFVQPERRLVERLIYPDEAAAQAAMARIEAGEDFETLVADRGLTLVDVDMGDVSRADLGPAGEAVFALAEPGVAGPLPTDLGPALFRMNGVLPAQEITFEEAREALTAEYAADAARRAIADRRETLFDHLAGGATIEELVAEEGLTAGTVDYYPGVAAEIAGYEAFQAAAAGLTEGDYPELIELDDGGLAVIQQTGTLPAAALPFEEVRAEVAEHWRASELSRRLGERAVEIKSEVEAGANLGAYGILDVTPVTDRQGYVEGAPPALMQAVFTMEPGQVRVIEGPDFTAVLRLDSVSPADPSDPGMAALRESLAVQVEAGLAADAMALFTQGLLAEAGIFIDEAALAAVHAQMQ